MMAEKDIPLASTGVSTDAGKIFFEDLKQTTNRLKVDFVPILTDAQNSIEEDAFIEYFLPVFSGEYGSDSEKIKAVLTSWYAVAGTPYAAVNVMKNGKVVAVVPPVHNNILSGKPTGRTEDTGAIFDNAAQQATLHPKLGHNVVIMALHERYLSNIPRPDLTAEQQAWFTLLNHYGKAPASMLAANNKAAGKEDPNQDDFEYE